MRNKIRENIGVVMSVNVAIFDIGSNSIRWLFGTYDGNSWTNMPKRMVMTRLGNTGPEKILQEASMDATIDAIRIGFEEAQHFGVTHMEGLATGAVREAPNGLSFVNRLAEMYSFPIRIISGEEEARYGFIGATVDLPLGGKTCAVVDIGGSTTEIAVGSNDGIQEKYSCPAGAVRLQSLSGEGIQRVWDETKGLWNPMKADHNFGGFIGIGGTLTTLAAIDLRLSTYDPNVIHGHYLQRETIEGLALQLRYMDEKEKSELLGLPANRRDIILPGTEILSSIMDYYDMGSIRVSEKDGMEGYQTILQRSFGHG